jgi:hypothetical protein
VKTGENLSEPLTDAEWLKNLKELEDLSAGDVIAPDLAHLTYAVCTDGVDACGWGGWLLEAAWTGTEAVFSNGVPAVTNQICPRCQKTLFRTLAQHRFGRLPETAAPGSAPSDTSDAIQT